MSEKKYGLTEVFYSLQGEGIQAGRPAIFVRFAGCSLDCKIANGYSFDCDTAYDLRERLTIEQLLARMDGLTLSRGWVVLTGGEPGLQVDRPLVDALHLAGYTLAIETNGTVDLSGLGLDWITVSPKAPLSALKQHIADDAKYVIACGEQLPRRTIRAAHLLVSPAFDGTTLDAATLAWCVQLCKDTPPWRLSVQNHKFWSIP
jgi:organic radical activating enzyme